MKPILCIFILHDFRCIISQNEKKRRKSHHGCSGVFLFYGPFFVVLKSVAFYGGVAAPAVTIRATKSLYEKTPDFSYTFWNSRILRIFADFWRKVRKSDFPTKRSHFRKKVFLFVSIRKNFFLANFFGESNFGHTFLCPFSGIPK